MKAKFLKILLFVMAAAAEQNLWAVSLPPGNVEGQRSANGQSFVLTWASPTLRTDGNPLVPGEISSFKVIRSNALTGGTTFITFTVLIASPTRLTDQTIAGRTFFYKIRAVDFMGVESQDSTIAASDSNNTGYFMADDGNSFAAAPGPLKSFLDDQGLILRGIRISGTEGNRVYKSVNYDVLDTLTNRVLNNYILPSPATFGIAYSVNGQGNVVPGTLAPVVSYPDAAGAKSAFSVYWNNGADWIKIGSSVDTTGKAAAAQSRLLGSFQLRLVSQPLSSQLNAVYPRTITPNNDAINDRVFFLFENPSAAAASGTIFDMHSAKVADLKSTDLFGGDTVLYWDGTDDNGAVVSGGIYIYKLEVGDKGFTGTVAVAR